ncbi:DUF1127 domain-containing protein [Arenibaculum pallidiluteum]|uniref:DUF1127 domain-containing protein n=1 Tax=Arenibaculum pallidiluteum TaxID=2812559 RepID=UPI001A95DA0C|nr:DUF1127 domain-containing protein [Arenibaculum pallidiluteum]
MTTTFDTLCAAARPSWIIRARHAATGFAARVANIIRGPRLLIELAAMSDRELADIGLARQDLHDATAMPLGCDPEPVLRARSEERRRRC